MIPSSAIALERIVPTVFRGWEIPSSPRFRLGGVLNDGSALPPPAWLSPPVDLVSRKHARGDGLCLVPESSLARDGRQADLSGVRQPALLRDEPRPVQMLGEGVP